MRYLTTHVGVKGRGWRLCLAVRVFDTLTAHTHTYTTRTSHFGEHKWRILFVACHFACVFIFSRVANGVAAIVR